MLKNIATQRKLRQIIYFFPPFFVSLKKIATGRRRRKRKKNVRIVADKVRDSKQQCQNLDTPEGLKI